MSILIYATKTAAQVLWARRLELFAGLLVASVAQAGGAAAASLPASPGAPLLSGEPCKTRIAAEPLSLSDAVSLALCANPKTRAAWVAIKLYAAEVRTAKDAYLPSLGAEGTYEESRTETKLKDAPELNTDALDHFPAGKVQLSWVLYDFGQRGNRLDSARQLLIAARANLDLSLQQVFLRAAADYYDAQAAQASVEATTQIEDLTQKNLNAAHSRMERGVAPVSDELQAKTAHAQAVLTRVKAQADFRAKLGALALDMGLQPDDSITMPPVNFNVAVDRDFKGTVRQLIEEAKRSHPSVAVAESQLAAAMSDERSARARGYPTISLVGQASRSNQPLAPSLGSPTIPGSVSNRSIALEIDVPISDLLWRRGTMAQARAHVQIQQEALQAAEQQVAADVWSSFTSLQADTDNLDNSQLLLDSARASLDATQHRYEGGAGSILELLNSQTAFANAQQQRIQSLADWRVARLALGASLGRLGLWATEGNR